MKPHRIRMTHNLMINYGLYEKMEIFVSQRARACMPPPLRCGTLCSLVDSCAVWCACFATASSLAAAPRSAPLAATTPRHRRRDDGVPQRRLHRLSPHHYAREHGALSHTTTNVQRRRRLVRAPTPLGVCLRARTCNRVAVVLRAPGARAPSVRAGTLLCVAVALLCCRRSRSQAACALSLSLSRSRSRSRSLAPCLTASTTTVKSRLAAQSTAPSGSTTASATWQSTGQAVFITPRRAKPVAFGEPPVHSGTRAPLCSRARRFSHHPATSTILFWLFWNCSSIISVCCTSTLTFTTATASRRPSTRPTAS